MKHPLECPDCGDFKYLEFIRVRFEEGNKRGKYGMRRPNRYLVFKAPDKDQENILFGKEYEKDKGYYMYVQKDGLFYKVTKSNYDKIFKWKDDLPTKTAK